MCFQPISIIDDFIQAKTVMEKLAMLKTNGFQSFEVLSTIEGLPADIQDQESLDDMTCVPSIAIVDISDNIEFSKEVQESYSGDTYNGVPFCPPLFLDPLFRQWRLFRTTVPFWEAMNVPLD
jgi:hypothetical protein